VRFDRCQHVARFPQLGIPIHAVHGNNIGDVAALYRMTAKSGGLFTYHGGSGAGTRRAQDLRHPHAEPWTSLRLYRDYDLVCQDTAIQLMSGSRPLSEAVNAGWSTRFGGRHRCPGVKAIPTWILATWST